MIRSIALAAALSMFAFPAAAFNCPALMAWIDAAMQTLTLSGLSVEDRAVELRQRGQELHEAGAHAQSMAALNEAMEIIEHVGH